MNNVDYAGFWVRVGAALIDTVLLLVIVSPVMSLIYGQEYWVGEARAHGLWDIVLNYFFPAIAVILFWIYKSATPGKMVLKLKIVDATTGDKPSTGQLIGRYLGYYVSMLPFFLGIIWVGIDKRKQGWHDKLAGTIVVKSAE
ncbi:MAG: RDD family protein [Halieaceae bacterium]|jgi:uncharacterized RDD family membrane protein YckC|nr:RDD family protein [Halieaceae bacterium]